jgi:hypothetical protein
MGHGGGEVGCWWEGVAERVDQGKMSQKRVV